MKQIQLGMMEGWKRDSLAVSFSWLEAKNGKLDKNIKTAYHAGYRQAWLDLTARLRQNRAIEIIQEDGELAHIW